MRAPGANHERQLSIADSVVSAIPDEIRDRYRLSVRDRPPSASPSAFRPPPIRRDSIFSFNTQWTADESFLESSGMIADFPRPPAMFPLGALEPALPSSSAHVVSPGWARGSPAASQYTESSFHSQHTEPAPRSAADHPLRPPNSPHAYRPNTAPSTLTVKTDAGARYLDPNTNAPIEVVTGSGPTTPSPTARFPPPLPGLPPPSDLPPLPRAPSSSSPRSQYLVPTPPGGAPGFTGGPLSPATAAFLNEPVLPPSSHASHERLLDPRFIRTMMSGIHNGGDGLDLSLSGEEQEGGPFGDRYAVEEAYYQDQADEPLPATGHRSVGAPATPATSPSNSHGTWFRRAPPAASLPSSPRSSFSMSVRSGMDKSTGWHDEDVPAVPPLPALYRQPLSQSRSGSSGSPPAPTTPTSQTASFATNTNGTLRPDWASRRKSVGKETIGSASGVSTITGGGASSGGQSHLSGITEKSVSGEEEAVVQHAALVRTASIAEMRPAVYTSAPGSPPEFAGDQRWSIGQGGAHARTTSADLLDRAVRNRRSAQQLQFLSVTHPDARRSAVEGVWEEEEEGEDLVYVRSEDVVRHKEAGESTGKGSTFTGLGSTYTGAGRDSGYVGSTRDSTYPGSTYPGAWAEPPSPNEMTPALGYAQPMIRGLATMPATPSHSTPGAGPSTQSPTSPGFSSPGPGTATFSALDTKKAQRASVTSYVSSMFSPFSTAHSSQHASAGHHGTASGTRTFAFSWRGNTTQEEVPPLPTPSPHVARMWEAYYRAGGSTAAPSAEAAHSHAGTTSESTRLSTVARREGTMELPALVQRAEKLNEMLELGRLPYRSKSSFAPSSPRVMDVPVGVDHEGNDVYSTTGGFTGEKPPRRTRSIRSVFTSISDRSRRFIGGGGGTSLRSSLVDIPGQGNMRFNKLPEEHRGRERKVQWGEGAGVKPARHARPARTIVSRRTMYIILAALIFIILSIISISVGLSRALIRRKPDAGGFTCKEVNQTGRLCDLDASCVCTSLLAGQCNPLANSVASLIDPVNRFFNPSPAFTPASVALSLWELQGSPLPGANCANQADLIDVGPALGNSGANRTEFARSALLWTLVMSMDVNGTARMQDFVQGLDFSLLDGPGAQGVAGQFRFGAAGYQVDFAALTVSQPVVSWIGAGKPSDEQVGLVGERLKAALDRVYTFAAASSAQRMTALQRYWTNVLQFPAGQLDIFRNIAKSSPVLFPFDATSSNIRQLFNNVNQSFPPPAACYPNLSTDELKAINKMETNAFGLDAVNSSPSALDSSCFSSRPVYGVLDLARLRTPFISGKPRQAVQLASAANSRVSVHLGRDLAGVPSASSSLANLTGTDDARTFGTLDNMDHVLLSYLQAFPSIQAASALVQYVLGASDVRAPPPTNTSALFNLTSSLDTLPVLEVALFGTVGPSDLGEAVADFATADGQLFFGSSDADAFRNWAVQRAGSVVWADGALAAQVVREGARDETFELVWKGASQLLQNAQTAGTKTSRSDVQRVVDAFGGIGYMGS